MLADIAKLASHMSCDFEHSFSQHHSISHQSSITSVPTTNNQLVKVRTGTYPITPYTTHTDPPIPQMQRPTTNAHRDGPTADMTLSPP
jgi:hypothetical protein